jgi:hypothetical protein
MNNKLDELNERKEDMDRNKDNRKGCANRGGAPVNLLEIVDDATLIKIVLEATTEVIDKGIVKPVYNIPKWFTPASLLSMTCYGYLTCRYNSSEISEGIRTDTALRYLSAKTFPDPSIFIKFRRANSEAIIQCVNIAINKVRSLCTGGNDSTTATTCAKRLPENKNCELFPDGEKRLAKAIMLDCLERDV